MTESLLKRNSEVKNSLNEVLDIMNNYTSKDASFRESVSDMNNKIKDVLEQIELKTFTVAVIATIKAGKSTFLNSLIGNEYLPTSNVPETSSLLFIKHNKEVYLQKNSENIYGISNIREEIRNRNKKYRDSGIDLREKYILYVPYEKISTVKNLNFQFIDTPGPNEAGAIALKTEVEKVLRIADVIVYLLDYTKLNSNDEHLLFGTISQLRSDLINEIKERLFFVVNKYDSKNQNSLTSDQTIAFVNNSLEKSIGLKTNKIHCISAEKALLVRMLQNNNYERINDLGIKSFGDEGWDEAAPIQQKMNMFDGKLETIIQKTGIPALEDDIINYIVNNSESLFYISIINKSLKLIQEIENRFLAKLSLMQKDKAELKRIFEELKGKVIKIEDDLLKIDGIVKSFSKEIEKEIEQRFDDFEHTISNIVDKVVNYKKSEADNSHKIIEEFIDTGADVAIELLAQGDSKSDKNHNKKVLKQLYKLGKSGLKSIKNIVQEWNKKVDPDEARQKIQNINEKIYELVQIGFTTVKEELEGKISLRSNEVNDELQRIINKANDELFNTINREFKMKDQISAVQIELPKDDSFKIMTDYDEFIQKTMKDKSGGWCKPSERVIDTVEIKTDLLARWWERELRRQKTASLKTVQKYINEAVVTKIEFVKTDFNNNAKTYLKMILSEQSNLEQKQEEKESSETLLYESIKRLKLLSNGIKQTNIIYDPIQPIVV